MSTADRNMVQMILGPLLGGRGGREHVRCTTLKVLSVSSTPEGLICFNISSLALRIESRVPDLNIFPSVRSRKCEYLCIDEMFSSETFAH